MKKNVVLLSLCLVLILSSFIIGSNIGGDFSGADGKIEDSVFDINSDYKPWFNSIWTPPSGEIESLLFSVQAAIGAGFIGYYIGKKKNV